MIRSKSRGGRGREPSQTSNDDRESGLSNASFASTEEGSSIFGASSPRIQSTRRNFYPRTMKSAGSADEQAPPIPKTSVSPGQHR